MTWKCGEGVGLSDKIYSGPLKFLSLYQRERPEKRETGICRKETKCTIRRTFQYPCEGKKWSDLRRGASQQVPRDGRSADHAQRSHGLAVDGSAVQSVRVPTDADCMPSGGPRSRAGSRAPRGGGGPRQAPGGGGARFPRAYVSARGDRADGAGERGNGACAARSLETRAAGAAGATGTTGATGPRAAGKARLT